MWPGSGDGRLKLAFFTALWVLGVFVLFQIAVVVRDELLPGRPMLAFATFGTLAAALVPGTAFAAMRVHRSERIFRWVLIAMIPVGALMLLSSVQIQWGAAPRPPRSAPQPAPIDEGNSRRVRASMVEYAHGSNGEADHAARHVEHVGEGDVLRRAVGPRRDAAARRGGRRGVVAVARR